MIDFIIDDYVPTPLSSMQYHYVNITSVRTGKHTRICFPSCIETHDYFIEELEYTGYNFHLCKPKYMRNNLDMDRRCNLFLTQIEIEEILKKLEETE